jgi:hypothetical protein
LQIWETDPLVHAKLLSDCGSKSGAVSCCYLEPNPVYHNTAFAPPPLENDPDTPPQPLSLASAIQSAVLDTSADAQSAWQTFLRATSRSAPDTEEASVLAGGPQPELATDGEARLCTTQQYHHQKFADNSAVGVSGAAEAPQALLLTPAIDAHAGEHASEASVPGRVPLPAADRWGDTGVVSAACLPGPQGSCHIAMLLVRRWRDGTAAERRARRELLIERLRNWPGGGRGGMEKGGARLDTMHGRAGRGIATMNGASKDVGRRRGRRGAGRVQRQAPHWDLPIASCSQRRLLDLEWSEVEYFAGLMEVGPNLGGGTWLRVVPLDAEFAGAVGNMVRAHDSLTISCRCCSDFANWL